MQFLPFTQRDRELMREIKWKKFVLGKIRTAGKSDAIFDVSFRSFFSAALDKCVRSAKTTALGGVARLKWAHLKAEWCFIFEHSGHEIFLNAGGE